MILTRIILVILYTLLLPLRLVGALLGRDPLQLREPKGGDSFWLVREPGKVTGESYFSEESALEGRPAIRQGTGNRIGGGVGRLLTPVLLLLARLHAPKSMTQEETAAHRAGGQEDIPDEIYTLW